MQLGIFHNLINLVHILVDVYDKIFVFALAFAALYFIISGPRQFLKLAPKTLLGGFHNLGLIFFNSLIYVFVFGGGTFLSNSVYKTYDLPHLTPEQWEHVPIWAVYAAVFILLDFSNFVCHKILHSKPLWGIHALHHTDEHLTWTTNYRVHILEIIVTKTVGLTLIGALFLPPEIVAIVAAIRSFYSCFVHCQLGLSYGWFDRVLVSPNYHYWHHADEPEAYGKNLALMFPIWDILFGSYYNPGICTVPTGVKDAPKDFILAQIYPASYVLNGAAQRLGLKAQTPKMRA